MKNILRQNPVYTEQSKISFDKNLEREVNITNSSEPIVREAMHVTLPVTEHYCRGGVK